MNDIVISVACEGLVYYIGGIMVCTFNVVFLVQIHGLCDVGHDSHIR